jgi:hypothetical protein
VERRVRYPALIAVYSGHLPDNRTIYFGIARSEADIWMVTLGEGGNR